MPRWTHPGQKAARRQSKRSKRRRAETPRRPSKPRHRPDTCEECGVRDGVATYEVHRHGYESGRAPNTLKLCPVCIRDRGASWRWRWRLKGRVLPDRGDAT